MAALALASIPTAAHADNFSVSFGSTLATYNDAYNLVQVSGGSGYAELQRPNGGIERIYYSRDFPGMDENATIYLRACNGGGCSAWKQGTS